MFVTLTKNENLIVKINFTHIYDQFWALKTH